MFYFQEKRWICALALALVGHVVSFIFGSLSYCLVEMCKTARRPGPAHKSPARGRAGPARDITNYGPGRAGPRSSEEWAGPGRPG